MKIQITKYDKFLTDFYEIYLWSIWEAEVKVKRGTRRGVPYQYKEYYIKTFPTYHGHFPNGVKTLIRAEECIELN